MFTYQFVIITNVILLVYLSYEVDIFLYKLFKKLSTEAFLHLLGNDRVNCLGGTRDIKQNIRPVSKIQLILKGIWKDVIFNPSF